MSINKEILSCINEKLYSRFCIGLDMRLKRTKLAPMQRHSVTQSPPPKKPTKKDESGAVFRSVTREVRDFTSKDQSQRPSFGQYNPNYAAVRPKEYLPFIRPSRKSANVAHARRGSMQSEVAEDELCSRLMYHFTLNHSRALKSPNKSSTVSPKSSGKPMKFGYSPKYLFPNHHIICKDKIVCEPNEVSLDSPKHVSTVDFGKLTNRTSPRPKESKLGSADVPSVSSNVKHIPEVSMAKTLPRHNFLALADVQDSCQSPSKDSVLSKLSYGTLLLNASS
eukprot:TRINITY_DN15165_c0_g4_i1.p1 TRINITY_DN15165_c0_g4~~TRINITY_DN15165_c0_g4_i1.p1  ORF type:complete len:279 (-),score=32.02 TRINITY_DN15165_c0_g4_i1:296-1132(-)